MEPLIKLICVLFISGHKFVTNFHFIRLSFHLEMFNATKLNRKTATRLMHLVLNLSNRKFQKHLHRLKSCKNNYANIFPMFSFFSNSNFWNMFVCIKFIYFSLNFSGVDDRSITVRIFDDDGFDIGEEIACMVNKITGTAC